jgi:hypothetical protein
MVFEYRFIDLPKATTAAHELNLAGIRALLATNQSLDANDASKKEALFVHRIAVLDKDAARATDFLKSSGWLP